MASIICNLNDLRALHYSFSEFRAVQGQKESSHSVSHPIVLLEPDLRFDAEVTPVLIRNPKV
jgi:hypothetical protein